MSSQSLQCGSCVTLDSVDCFDTVFMKVSASKQYVEPLLVHT